MYFRDGGRGEHRIHLVHNIPDTATSAAEPLLLLVRALLLNTD